MTTLFRPTQRAGSSESEDHLSTQRQESCNAPPLPSTAVAPADVMMIELLAERCREIVQAITSTQEGRSRAWMNVQPCVLSSTKILCQAAAAQSLDMRRLTEQVQQQRHILHTLIDDRRVKEERYALDQQCTSADFLALEAAVEKLQAALDAERRERRRYNQEVVVDGMEELKYLITSGEGGFVHHPRQQPTKACEGPSLEEVRHLRRQWKDLRQRLSIAARHAEEMNAATEAAHSGERRRGASPTDDEDVESSTEAPAVASTGSARGGPRRQSAGRADRCTRWRWVWRGDQHSHFSSALRRRNGSPRRGESGPTMSVSPPICWDQQRWQDASSMRWHDGFLHRRHNEEGPEEDGAVLWATRSSIVISTTAMYRITVCLARYDLRSHVEDATPAGQQSKTSRHPSAPVIAVYVNRDLVEVSGASMSQAKATTPTLRYHQHCGTTAAAAVTNTTSMHLFVTAGSTLKVRCHNLHDTTVVHDAWMEMELLSW